MNRYDFDDGWFDDALKLDGNSLQHYTNEAGILGILEHGKIWLTDIRYMNDSSEYLDGIRTAGDILFELHSYMYDEGKLVDPTDAHVAEILQQAGEIIASNESSKYESTYVFCLSEKLDDLSQWRAYGGANSSFSIGFSRRILQQVARDTPESIFSRCVYRFQEKFDVIRSLVNQFRERYKGENHSFAMELATQIDAIIPFFKHESFAAENEFRLIIRRTDQELKFRAGRSSPIPFIEKSFTDFDDRPKKGLDQIWLGPNPYISVANKKERWIQPDKSDLTPSLPSLAVLAMLEEHGFESKFGHPFWESGASSFFNPHYDKNKYVRVIESRIPFRDY